MLRVRALASHLSEFEVNLKPVILERKAENKTLVIAQIQPKKGHYQGPAAAESCVGIEHHAPSLLTLSVSVKKQT